MKIWLVVLVLLVFVSVAFAQTIQVTGGPTVFVDSNGQVRADMLLKNVGSTMTSNWIIEMQVRPTGAGPLSVSDQTFMCNPAYPANVHKRYFLTSGEQNSMSLTAGVSPGTYDVFIFSRTGCGGTPTTPFATGPNDWSGRYSRYGLVVGGSTPTTNPPPTVPPTTPTTLPPSGTLVLMNQDIRVEENKVIGAVTIKNTGSSMLTSNIVEMQVRPQGKPALEVLGIQKTCNPSYPNNVHRSFQLNSGEQMTISLDVGNLKKGFYDVYMLTRSKCATDVNNPSPFERTEPLPYGEQQKTTVEVVQGGGDITGIIIIIAIIIIALGAAMVFR